MVREPYINVQTGEIKWANTKNPLSELHDIGSMARWTPYADFEREKLRELSNQERTWQYEDFITIDPRGSKGGAFQIGRTMVKSPYTYEVLNSYDIMDYMGDYYSLSSESNRLLKRAEFLKAVCEKENVEFLPKKGWLTTEQEDKIMEESGETAKCLQCGKDVYFPDPPTEISQCLNCYIKNPPKKKEETPRDYYTKEEEKEFRRELLQYLAIPNCGVTDGMHIPRFEAMNKLQKLRTRFLSEIMPEPETAEAWKGITVPLKDEKTGGITHGMILRDGRLADLCGNLVATPNRYTVLFPNE